MRSYEVGEYFIEYANDQYTYDLTNEIKQALSIL